MTVHHPWPCAFLSTRQLLITQALYFDVLKMSLAPWDLCIILSSSDTIKRRSRWASITVNNLKNNIGTWILFSRDVPSYTHIEIYILPGLTESGQWIGLDWFSLIFWNHSLGLTFEDAASMWNLGSEGSHLLILPWWPVVFLSLIPKIRIWPLDLESEWHLHCNLKIC